VFGNTAGLVIAPGLDHEEIGAELPDRSER
jgi:hypothetical protein